MPHGFFLEWPQALLNLPQANSSTKLLTRAAWGFWAAGVFMFLLMLGRPAFSTASVPVHGISSPGLALQFARDPADVELILSEYPSQDRITMQFKQYEDFVFIASYVGLFVVLGALLARRGDAWGGIAGTAGAICGFAAGVFDVLENRAILAVLDVPMRGTTQNMVNAISRPSTAKWALSAAALALLSTHFFGHPRWYARAAGWLMAALAAVVVVMLIYYRKFAP
jgi:hypothetical protein